MRPGLLRPRRVPVATNFWGIANGLCRYLFRGPSQHHPVQGKCALSDYLKHFWNVKRGSAYNMTLQSLYQEGSYEQIISKDYISETKVCRMFMV